MYCSGLVLLFLVVWGGFLLLLVFLFCFLCSDTPKAIPVLVKCTSPTSNSAAL